MRPLRPLEHTHNHQTLRQNIIKGKGKVHPRTGHEGTVGE